MINKLKKRFVLIGTLSVFLFLLLVVSAINIISYKTMIKDIDTVIDVVSKPNAPFFKEHERDKNPREMFGEFLPKNMSPEVPFETRFFSVIVSPSGEIISDDKTQIIAIRDNDINYYVENALKTDKEKGFIDNFRFKKENENSNSRFIFVDCGRRLDTFNNMLKISCIIALLGCVIICVVFIAVSGKVVAPIVNNYNKQKSFITNAGHEIKTPLTIISANTDLLESEYGNNDSIDDIKKQTEKLKELTNKLVLLSKTQEENFSYIKVIFPFSELVLNCLDSFNGIILNNKIELTKNIEPLLSVNGDQNAIEQAINIIIENAIKYTPQENNISVNVYSNNKKVIFNIENDSNEEIDEKELEYVFERFYRADKSRNSKIGGHGLGLSIAKTIIEANNGKIRAKKTTDNRFQIEITFRKENI